MTQPLDIAVVGATGSVGETLVQILEELDFPVATLHLLYINTRFLPAAIRPSRARCAVLVAMSLFYGFFVVQSIRSVVGSAGSTG